MNKFGYCKVRYTIITENGSGPTKLNAGLSRKHGISLSKLLHLNFR